MRVSCIWCGKPRATDEDWTRYEGGEGTHICWADPQCELCGDEDIVRALRAENERLRALLREVAECGVESADERVRYVTVQIDRDTWAAVQEEANRG